MTSLIEVPLHFAAFSGGEKFVSWILGRLAVVPFKGFFVVGGTTWRLEILTEIRNSRRNNKFVFVMCGSGGLQSNSLVIQGWEECWEEGAEFGIRLSLDALGAKPPLDKSHWIFSCCLSMDYSLNPITLPSNLATPSSAVKKTSWDLKISS